MRVNSLLTELMWIVGILLSLILSGIVVLGKEAIFEESVEIQLHDSYFVFNFWSMIISLFLVIASLIYLVKEAVNKFNRILPNFFLSLLLIVMMLSLALAIRDISQLQGGAVIYPPLDAEALLEDQVEEMVIIGVKLLVVLELFLGMGLILLGIRTGRLIKKKKYIG